MALLAIFNVPLLYNEGGCSSDRMSLETISALERLVGDD